jgi:hypothetical protein
MKGDKGIYRQSFLVWRDVVWGDVNHVHHSRKVRELKLDAAVVFVFLQPYWSAEHLTNGSLLFQRQIIKESGRAYGFMLGMGDRQANRRKQTFAYIVLFWLGGLKPLSHSNSACPAKSLFDCALGRMLAR